MNTIIFNFHQILDFAREYNLPSSKKRAILREYLQVKILEFIYSQRLSKNIFFIGGTSLRLLRNLDRFSEDLDFDVVDIENKHIDQMMILLTKQLKHEQFSVHLYRNKTDKRTYYELRFQKLLSELKISQYDEENLVIKLDFESIWNYQQREVKLLSRYGILTNIVTIPINLLLVQKLVAYLNRTRTQPRDIYDIVWLIGQGAVCDKFFMQKNEIRTDPAEKALHKFEKEKKQLTSFKRRIKPYLINEHHIQNLDIFPVLIDKIISPSKT